MECVEVEGDTRPVAVDTAAGGVGRCRLRVAVDDTACAVRARATTSSDRTVRMYPVLT